MKQIQLLMIATIVTLSLVTVGIAEARTDPDAEPMVREVEQFDGFINFLMQASFGSRDDSSNFKALNVLTMLDHLNKKYGISHDQYDHLSEYTHPNLKGGLMAYSDIDLKTLSAEFGINPGGLPLDAFGLGELELILEIGIDEYKAIEKDTKDFEEMVWRLAPEIFQD